MKKEYRGITIIKDPFFILWIFCLIIFYLSLNIGLQENLESSKGLVFIFSTVFSVIAGVISYYSWTKILSKPLIVKHNKNNKSEVFQDNIRSITLILGIPLGLVLLFFTINYPLSYFNKNNNDDYISEITNQESQIEIPTPTLDPDPYVTCHFLYHEPLIVRESVCAKSVECQVGNKYNLYNSAEICDNVQKQYTELVRNYQAAQLKLIQDYLIQVQQANVNSNNNQYLLSLIRNQLNRQSTLYNSQLNTYKSNLDTNLTQSDALNNLNSEIEKSIAEVRNEGNVLNNKWQNQNYNLCIDSVNSKYNFYTHIDGGTLTQYYNDLTGCSNLLN